MIEDVARSDEAEAAVRQLVLGALARYKGHLPADLHESLARDVLRLLYASFTASVKSTVEANLEELERTGLCARCQPRVRDWALRFDDEQEEICDPGAPPPPPTRSPRPDGDL